MFAAPPTLEWTEQWWGQFLGVDWTVGARFRVRSEIVFGDKFPKLSSIKKWFQSIPLHHWLTGQYYDTFFLFMLSCYEFSVFFFFFYYFQESWGSKKKQIAVGNVF